jgi:formate/nitrite transporter FocA (FNT family)
MKSKQKVKEHAIDYFIDGMFFNFLINIGISLVFKVKRGDPK